MNKKIIHFLLMMLVVAFNTSTLTAKEDKYRLNKNEEVKATHNLLTMLHEHANKFAKTPFVELAKRRAEKTNREVKDVLLQNELFWELITDLEEMKVANAVDEETGCMKGGSQICETTLTAHKIAQSCTLYHETAMIPLAELAKRNSVKTGRAVADILLQNELFWELIMDLQEMQDAEKADMKAGCIKGGSEICETIIAAQRLAQSIGNL